MWYYVHLGKGKHRVGRGFERVRVIKGRDGLTLVVSSPDPIHPRLTVNRQSLIRQSILSKSLPSHIRFYLNSHLSYHQRKMSAVVPPLPPALPALDSTFGALFIGVVVAGALWGITCSQTFLYYRGWVLDEAASQFGHSLTFYFFKLRGGPDLLESSSRRCMDTGHGSSSADHSYGVHLSRQTFRAAYVFGTYGKVSTIRLIISMMTNGGCVW